MSNQILDQILEKKNPSQYGSLADMLTLEPNSLIDGHVFYNTSDSKLYFASPLSQTTKANAVAEVRSGNFAWIECKFDEEAKSYSKGDSTFRHSKMAKYPLDQANDDADVLFEMSQAFLKACGKESDEQKECKQKWKALLTSGNNALEQIESLMGKKVNPEFLEKAKEANWLQPVMLQIYEMCFILWAQQE